MNTPVLLEGFAAELVRRGLPVDYSQSTAAELADHHRDLTEELRTAGLGELEAEIAAGERLGERCLLVKKSVREFQSRYWCARWPLITFLFGPLALLVLTWVAFGLVAVCVGFLLEKLGFVGPGAPDGIVSTGEWLVNLITVSLICFAAPAIAILSLARLAKRAALNWKWLVVSACLLGLTIGMVRCGFREERQHPTMMDGTPVPADLPLITVGVPIFASTWAEACNWYTHDVQQTCQVFLPVVLAAALAMRAKQLSLRAQRLECADC